MPNPSAGLLEGINTTMAEPKIAVATGGLVVYSITAQDWVAIVTFTFVLLQIILLIPKYGVLFRNLYNRFPFMKWLIKSPRFKRISRPIKRHLKRWQ